MTRVLRKDTASESEVGFKTKSTVFFAFSDNFVDTCVHDAAVFLTQHKLLHVLVVSGASIERDISRVLCDREKFDEWFAKEIIATMIPNMKYSPSVLATMIGKCVMSMSEPECENSFCLLGRPT